MLTELQGKTDRRAVEAVGGRELLPELGPASEGEEETSGVDLLVPANSPEPLLAALLPEADNGDGDGLGRERLGQILCLHFL